MADLFWLSDEQWAVLEPFMPKNQSGARRVDDRRVISGIVHVLKSGGRWRDCPAEYGPHTTLSQPLQQMVPPGLLARHVGGARASWMDRRDGVARQHLCQGAPLRARRQRGAKAQAIGPSITRRADHQAPRACRRPRAARRHPPFARQRQRREDRARGAGESTGSLQAAHCGSRLRRQPSTSRPESGRNDAHHPRHVARASGRSSTTSGATRIAGVSRRRSAA